MVSLCLACSPSEERASPVTVVNSARESAVAGIKDMFWRARLMERLRQISGMEAADGEEEGAGVSTVRTGGLLGEGGRDVVALKL